ncbi:chromatin accessibility complex protein 1-like [Limulus polyphemus]|uniref:Chromatin accessibility complex protein 1-like n=1 Tax=Limulus polyphemus TaxID=6850 RepID=A0ABM1BTZ5_LIMPO|nr:chromatin accessibility complex protein 1-like [Limulus polyphemus]
MEGSSKASKHGSFPTSRIRMIMRSSPDVTSISPDSVTLISKAAELFVTYLAQQAHHRNEDKTEIDYDDLAEIVNTQDHLEFLLDIIPRKIKIAEYLEILKKVEKEEEEREEIDI